MKNLLIYFVVFICGAAILGIELLGTRIIGPFYGVSLFLWSALISVTLLALSAGYITGGRLADKRLSLNILGFIIGAAGILIVILHVYRDMVIINSEGFGLRSAVLISSFVLFFPPLMLLGMVSPYSIKLRAESLAKIGTHSGNLYAVSTIGSVLAALLTGFILIPSIGVYKLTLACGVLLLFTSALCFAGGKKKFYAVVMILTAIIALYFMFKNKNEVRTVSLEQSSYGEIRVMDIDETRFLLIDGGIHSAVSISINENQMPYVWVVDILKNLKGYSGDMLLIGVGGGSILKSFYKDNWDCEAVEIDPIVTRTAIKYFGLNETSGKIHHMDGREFLKVTDHKYDVIIFDAFGSSSVPFHLITKEAFSLAKSRLHKDGIAAINIECEGWDDIIVKSSAATLKKIFRYVLILPIAEPPNSLGNVILFASDEPLDLKKEIIRDYTDPDYRFSDKYEQAHAWDNKFEISDGEGIVLTDDRNPVDIWSDRINLVARKELHSMLGVNSFLWQ